MSHARRARTAHTRTIEQQNTNTRTQVDQFHINRTLMSPEITKETPSLMFTGDKICSEHWFSSARGITMHSAEWFEDRLRIQQSPSGRVPI